MSDGNYGASEEKKRRSLALKNKTKML